MENIIIKELDNGLFSLTPAEGYRLYNTITRRFYSSAEVKDIRPYKAVKEAPTLEDEDTM